MTLFLSVSVSLLMLLQITNFKNLDRKQLSKFPVYQLSFSNSCVPFNCLKLAELLTKQNKLSVLKSLVHFCVILFKFPESQQNKGAVLKLIPNSSKFICVNRSEILLFQKFLWKSEPTRNEEKKANSVCSTAESTVPLHCTVGKPAYSVLEPHIV